MKYMRIIAAAGAILALSQSQVALAQAAAAPCIRQADLADAVVYSMPSMISAFNARCGSTLSSKGYMATQGAKLTASYAAQQPTAWPGARRFLLQFVASKAKSNDQGMMDMITNLPSDTVRPFVDAMIQQEVSKQIPVKDCGNIEQGVSLLAPLPPKNMGGLAVFLFQMANVKKPTICENVRS